jgi:malonate-semialdehyde dehydrogenase (acetylating)/methylmalonate-semialdehyde dehydrogenase
MAIAVAVAVGDAADPLVERLERKAREVKVGPGLAPDSEMGPVITQAARERIVEYVGKGERAGATPVVDGRELDVDGDGYFVGPTLFDNVQTDKRKVQVGMIGVNVPPRWPHALPDGRLGRSGDVSAAVTRCADFLDRPL